MIIPCYVCVCVLHVLAAADDDDDEAGRTASRRSPTHTVFDIFAALLVVCMYASLFLLWRRRNNTNLAVLFGCVCSTVVVVCVCSVVGLCLCIYALEQSE